MLALVFTCLFICKINGAIFQTFGSRDFPFGTRSFQTFDSRGTAFFVANNQDKDVLSQSAYNGAAISVSQDNGDNEIAINGKPVNLLNSVVLEENNRYKVLEPAEMPGARITVNNATKQITVDYKGAHYQSMTPEMDTLYINQAVGKEALFPRTDISKLLCNSPSLLKHLGGKERVLRQTKYSTIG